MSREEGRIVGLSAAFALALMVDKHWLTIVALGFVAAKEAVQAVGTYFDRKLVVVGRRGLAV